MALSSCLFEVPILFGGSAGGWGQRGIRFIWGRMIWRCEWGSNCWYWRLIRFYVMGFSLSFWVREVWVNVWCFCYSSYRPSYQVCSCLTVSIEWSCCLILSFTILLLCSILHGRLLFDCRRRNLRWGRRFCRWKSICISEGLVPTFGSSFFALIIFIYMGIRQILKLDKRLRKEGEFNELGNADF